MFNSNEIYSDEIESILFKKKLTKDSFLIIEFYLGENEIIESVRQLDEIKKLKNENENNLEELLRKSRQLISSKCVRLIDQGIVNLPTKRTDRIESLILSCNLLDKTKQIDWNKLPKDLQVFIYLKKTKFD